MQLAYKSTALDRIAIRVMLGIDIVKYVPPHVNIFYCFGGLVFTSFIAQVTTGAAMTFYYVPEVSRVHDLDGAIPMCPWIAPSLKLANEQRDRYRYSE